MTRPVGIPVAGEVMVVAVVIKLNPVDSRFLLFDYFSLTVNWLVSIWYNSTITK